MRRGRWRQAAFGAVLACVPGCAALSPDLDPDSMYNSLVGGDVEPAPGQDAAWPNLATVPPRPVQTPAAERQRIQNALIADRANARHAGGPTPPASPAPAPPLVLPDGQAVPTSPPPPPAFAGVPLVTAPPAPRPPPVPAPQEVGVEFSRGSAVLSTGSVIALRHFAEARGSARVSVIGSGDAASAGADALGLGLARAEAVANALRAAGVPADAIQIGAGASGRGALARLIH